MKKSKAILNESYIPEQIEVEGYKTPIEVFGKEMNMFTYQTDSGWYIMHYKRGKLINKIGLDKRTDVIDYAVEKLEKHFKNITEIRDTLRKYKIVNK